MAELYKKWYSSAMTIYENIYEIAVDNHYLITTEEAAEIGIPAIELAKLAHRGKLEHMGRGLYRLARYIPGDTDPYAIAVARFGKGAYLYGESVIAMLELAPTNPDYVCVAVPKRTRKAIPDSIRLFKTSENDTITAYDGIPCQSVACAIASARTTMMDDRLQDAANRAKEEGYLTTRALNQLKDEMKWR
ncbi:MAG: type IV toxin-antitoxin system AbiEi family antitoxin domain-containing protein [Raoultibacter sp.]